VTQSRRMSALETATNLVVGSSIYWLCNFFILPIWGFQQSVGAATSITVLYTVFSIARSYTIRRVFNWL
jgi:multisubunit Na+/H+ antiporter MnhB subunit